MDFYMKTLKFLFLANFFIAFFVEGSDDDSVSMSISSASAGEENPTKRRLVTKLKPQSYDEGFEAGKIAEVNIPVEIPVETKLDSIHGKSALVHTRTKGILVFPQGTTKDEIYKRGYISGGNDKHDIIKREACMYFKEDLQREFEVNLEFPIPSENREIMSVGRLAQHPIDAFIAGYRMGSTDMFNTVTEHASVKTKEEIIALEKRIHDIGVQEGRASQGAAIQLTSYLVNKEQVAKPFSIKFQTDIPTDKENKILACTSTLHGILLSPNAQNNPIFAYEQGFTDALSNRSNVLDERADVMLKEARIRKDDLIRLDGVREGISKGIAHHMASIATANVKDKKTVRRNSFSL
jgi:hypothetical protein